MLFVDFWRVFHLFLASLCTLIQFFTCGGQTLVEVTGLNHRVIVSNSSGVFIYVLPITLECSSACILECKLLKQVKLSVINMA